MGAPSPKAEPVGAYRIYVDGSRSMAPFLAPDDADGIVTVYEEMLFRLFTEIDTRDSAQTWLFGDTLVQLPNAPEARQRLVTRGTYDRGQSRLEFAFRNAKLYLDSLASTRPGPPARPRQSGMVIILTDGLQSGSGRQLHILAEFDRMIRDHVANGGSFAFIGGMGGQYPANGAGRNRPGEAKPVLAFLFGTGAARVEVEGLARKLAEGIDARSGDENSRFFVLPVPGAAPVHLRPRSGVRQVLSAQDEPPVFTFQTGAEAVELLVDAGLDAGRRANLPALTVRIDRCAGGAWEPAGDPSGWAAEAVRIDSARSEIHLALRRRNAASVRTGFFRVRLEGSPVPPWVSEFGAGDNVSRFFGGLQELAGTDAATFGTFYLRVRSD